MTQAKELPAIEELNAAFTYDAESGRLMWKVRPDERSSWNTRFAGKEAFTCINNSGYRSGTFSGRGYLAHRIIWKMVHGDEPGQIDHINGDRTDNRAVNLRLATPLQNAANRKTHGLSRFKGVCKGAKSWCMVIGSRKVCGFQSEMAAAAAYDAEAVALYGEFARLNFPERTAA
jgi:hypothetical protein